MKSARAPAIAVIVLVLLVALLFDPEPRRLDSVAPVSAAASVPSSVSAATALSDVWFCAGGTALDDGFADHRVLLINTSDVERVASINAVGSRVAPATQGPTGTRRVTLPPYARSELRLAELVPNSAYASATVELSGGGVVVEHSVTGPAGFDRAPCATTASAEWFVPLAATATEKNPTARAVLVLYNPFADNAVLDVTFTTEDASVAAPGIESMVVGPGAVEIVDLTALVPVADQVATAVRARAGRVVLDRIQVFDDARLRRDLVLTTGVPAVAPTWFFPSGRLGAPRQERLVVFNPSDDRAEVLVEVRPDDRLLIIEPFALQVGPGRFAVVDLSAEQRLSDAGVAGYSVIVRSLGPAVAVDRLVTLAPGQPGAGASSTIGSAFAAPMVIVDGGASEADPGELIVFNPNARAIAAVSLEVIANGERRAAPAGTDFELQPGERKSLPFALLGTGSFTVIVSASAPVVAERENAANNVRAAAMGIPARATAQIPNAITLELGE
ncbi:MAG TPA: DUF5719 family protein [Acidimicrobiales bacterium]|nr:DUF5719 family protein [Acidimicrobiales bacterium]